MSVHEIMVRPNLPRDWYQPEWSMFAIYLIYSAAMLVGCGYLSYCLWFAELTLWLKIPLLAITLLLASNGFHLLGWFAHDGVHLSLARNKHVSVVLGCFVGAIALFPTLGYGITHWTHHRFTNQESDPDTQIYSRYRGFWSRFFLSRLVANRGYFKNTWCLIFNKPINKYHPMPFARETVRLFAVLSVLFIVFWLAVYCTIALWNWQYALLAIAIPYLLSIPITGLRIYIEHTGTGGGIFRDTRTYASPLYTCLLFGNNFHLEHHLYPRVPAYKLIRVHRFLRDRGYFDRWQSHVVSGVAAPLKYATGSYQYPEALVEDAAADPFDINNRPQPVTAEASPSANQICVNTAEELVSL